MGRAPVRDADRWQRKGRKPVRPCSCCLLLEGEWAPVRCSSAREGRGLGRGFGAPPYVAHIEQSMLVLGSMCSARTLDLGRVGPASAY